MRLSPKTLIAGAAAAAVLAVAPAAGAATYATGGSTGMQVVATALAQAYAKETKGQVRFTVAGGGSGAGVNGVNSGTFVIGNSSSAPSSTTARGLIYTPITVEPFVVIVNSANKVSSLTQQQISDIFTGKITNWSQVGGENCAIKGYTRITGSGTLNTFRSLYLNNAAISGSFAAVGSNGLIRSGVAGNKCAVGFVTFAYTVGTTLPIKPLAVGGVAPSLANTKSGKFTYAGYQYFVTKGYPNDVVQKYLDWCRGSGTAKAIIEKYALPTTAAQIFT